MPVQIQQLSPDVYYVTPPEQPFNQFSSFMAGYLKTRTPWTQRLFQMRVAALDPSARLAALRGLERDKMALEKSAQAQDARNLKAVDKQRGKQTT